MIGASIEVTSCRPGAPRWLRCGLLVIAVLFLATAPASAKRKPGLLDKSFGEQGRATRAIRPLTPVLLPFTKSATAPGNELVVLVGATVLRYDQDGKLDRSFGEHGRLRVTAPAGMQFKPRSMEPSEAPGLSGLAVDSRGRVLLAGTTIPSPTRHMPGPYGPSPSSAVVLRFLASGQPDPTFGEDGVVSTDLGLSPPVLHEIGGGEFRYEAPVVQLTGLTIDSEDQPILIGTAVREMSGCRDLVYGSVPMYEGFMARLSATGALDPSFAGTGVRVEDGLFATHELIAYPSGGDIFLANSGSQCGVSIDSVPTLARIGPDGVSDPAFGSQGWKALPAHVEGGSGLKPYPESFYFADAMAVDSFGRILLLQRRLNPHGLQVVRLRPDGSLDERFGRGGAITLPIAKRTYIRAIAADSKGRVLLAGSRSRRRCFHCNPKRGMGPLSTFVVIRLRRNGSVDQSFGRRGRTRTGFPGFGRKTEASADQILADRRGRIILAGTVYSHHFSTGVGLGFTRYFP